MTDTLTNVQFWKMDGSGNDFVILDYRGRAAPVLTEAQLTTLARRDNAVTQGCDQIIVVLDDSTAEGAMVIYNADGSRVDACGNASRCVGWLLAEAAGKLAVRISNAAGMLHAQVRDAELQMMTVDMGAPRLQWQQIPLAQDMDTLALPIIEDGGRLSNPTATSMGNPHMTFFVEQCATVDFINDQLGHRLEHHPLFPERVNVGVAQVITPQEIHLRVYERGVGETLACGTGACAAVVAGVRRNLLEGEVLVHTRGGSLTIHWQREGAGHVMMTGPVRLQFRGTL